MDLDEVADELYALPPEEFTAARREHEALARAAGDRALAKEIAGLGRPSTAAWVCNLLVRRQPDEVAGLVELGGMLREAQENLDGDQLRQLDVQRRQLVAALARQARRIAAEEGHRVTESIGAQVEETLRAAMADPSAAELLRCGRLTSAMSYSGLGTPPRPDLRVVRAPTRSDPQSRARAGTRVEGARRVGTRVEEERRAAEEKRRAAAEERRAAAERRRRELAEARRAAEEAADLAREAEDAARAARDRAAELAAAQDERRRQLDDLLEQVERLRAEVDGVGSELQRAERRVTSAERRAAGAAETRTRAEARLAELETAPLP